MSTKVNKLTKGQSKRFDEKFDKAVPRYTVYEKEEIKQHLANELTLQEKVKKAPMGVSQWRNHGKKWGYWEYFEKKIKKEIKSRLEKMDLPSTRLGAAIRDELRRTVEEIR